ncbi:hypothetical protein OZ664_15055 [Elizabethkingia sp. HX WHF]|nr:MULTISPECIES: hypothetical protein [Elizabethkingia]MDX8565325.1 hypothetical protein [Elizabethkingia sp. HX WHF]
MRKLVKMLRRSLIYVTGVQESKYSGGILSLYSNILSVSPGICI